jgi:hypothetical protein
MTKPRQPQSVTVATGYAEFRELNEGERLVMRTRTDGFPLIIPDTSYLPHLFFFGLKLSDDQRASGHRGPVAIAGLGHLDLAETASFIRFGDAVAGHIAQGMYLLDSAWVGFPKPVRGTPAFQGYLQGLKQRFATYLPHIFEIAFDPIHPLRWSFGVDATDSRHIGYSVAIDRVLPSAPAKPKE